MFKGVKDFKHSDLGPIGVLYVNLGSPDAPTSSALRRYLRQFLSDKRVIELPRIKWWPILNLIVLVFRPRKSAKLYSSVWTDEGAPLLVTTEKQGALLQQKLEERIGEPVHVAVGMTYGNPSVESALDYLREKKIRRLLLLPAYAQYSATSSGSVFDVAVDGLKKWRWVPDFRAIMTYHDNQKYIAALANSVREHWEKNGRAELLLLSFHGIPLRYFQGGDPYHCYCYKTARLVAEQLGIEKDKYLVSFQSIFGKERWIEPATDKTLERLAKEGLKSVDVICPGFSADCLETLEEIEVENRHLFLEAGGEKFSYIPALNLRDDFIEALAQLACDNMSGWITSKEKWDQAAAQSLSDKQQLMAEKMEHNR